MKEEFESHSELAHILATQYMAEFGVHQRKGVKTPEGLPVTNLAKARKDDYDILRLLEKQHSFNFAKALFWFGEARRAYRKATLAPATVRHKPN